MEIHQGSGFWTFVSAGMWDFRFASIMTAMALIFVSCEDIMDVDFAGNKSRNLVVEGSITTDTMAHQVMLSFTGDFFDRPPKEMATGASVSIADGEKVFQLYERTPGEYITDSTVYGEVGKTYTLWIKLQDGSEYTASDLLRPCTDLDSIVQSLNYNTHLEGYGYDVLYYGREPEPAGDYYLHVLYIDNKLYTDTITEVSFASDEFINGNYISDYPVFRIREADIVQPNTPVRLDMYSISKQYYDFMAALMVETIWKGSPWDGPPANLPGNISNGALGFFRASDVKRKEKLFQPLPRAN
jgi:hypothetical protein